MSNYQNEQTQEKPDSSGLNRSAFNYAQENSNGYNTDLKNFSNKDIDNSILNMADNAEDAQNVASSASKIAETGESANAVSTGASAATGASTGGISFAVQAALYAMKKAKSEIDSLSHLGTLEDDYKSNSFLLVFIVFLSFLFLFCTIVLKGTPGSTENYKRFLYSFL